MMQKCPVCNSNETSIFREVAGFLYFECLSCEVIFISTEVLEQIDAGNGIVKYSEEYWQNELRSARERSWGTSLARVAEAFLFARIPIKKFIDIASGPGYLLDALNYQLPSSGSVFFANELFPPAEEYCTGNKNYLKGDLLNFNMRFDAGSCIEVIEHMTPLMVKKLFSDLALCSNPSSIYIFNTGLVSYTKNEEIGYLDPLVRGHIMSWSIKGLQTLVNDIGFIIIPIPGKTWAFLAEYKPDHNFEGGTGDRIWHPHPENRNILNDKKTGELMYILGLESARAYS